MKREKVDLHLHLDGSLSPALVERFLKEAGRECNLEDLKKKLSVPPGCQSLEEYLECFGLPLQVLQKKENLEAAAEDLVHTLSSQGLTYAEIRFAPQLHQEEGMSQLQAVEAAISGLNRGLGACPSLQACLLLCMMVNGEDKENEETVELAAAFHGKGVGGLDLAGPEGRVPMEHFRPFFAKAGRMGVPFTIHAGECGDPENIKKAVSFGASRIGHGCAAIRDRECMELLRREGILLEMCPTSNLQTQAVTDIRKHPIRTFLEFGIRVSVNTDNMTASGTTLDQEYALLERELQFTPEEIRHMNEDARKAAFL